MIIYICTYYEVIICYRGFLVQLRLRVNDFSLSHFLSTKKSIDPGSNTAAVHLIASLKPQRRNRIFVGFTQKTEVINIYKPLAK